jgi:hypothetical protein
MNERIQQLAEQAWRATSDEVAHLECARTVQRPRWVRVYAPYCRVSSGGYPRKGNQNERTNSKTC